MVELRWDLTFLFGCISSYFILGNPLTAIVYRLRGRNFSFVPFLGGIFGFAACWTSPWTTARYFCWVPLIADVTIPIFIYALVFTDTFRKK